MRPTLATWQHPEHLAWGFTHMRELVTTARVKRAATAVPLRVREGDEPAAFAELLADEYTDGAIVLHDGAVVAEAYARGMTAEDTHLLQSVSKSITGVLAGILIGKGVLAAEDPVLAHVPELEGSGFDGASVRDLLDMRAGTRFDETYEDPDSDIRASEAQFGWAPGPPPAPDSIAYLRSLGLEREHGGRFEYRSILTDALGLVLERAAGAPFAELLSRELWRPLGTEFDADLTVDPDGFAVVDGGLCVALRDLARFGRLLLDDGVTADGERLLPDGWVQDTLRGAEDSVAAFGADEHAATLPGGHYRNQFWVPPGRRVLLCLGIHGQFVFVDRRARVVVAKVSTWPTPLDPDRHALTVRACAALAAELGG
jgi:CubicO group peptidase (beta-lactamase class C family)